MPQHRSAWGQVAQANVRSSSISARISRSAFGSSGDTFSGSSSRFRSGLSGQRLGLSRIMHSSTRTGTVNLVEFRPRGEENHCYASLPTVGFENAVNTRQVA